MAEKSRWSLGAKLKGLFARSDADETVDDIFDDVPSLPRNEEVEREVVPEPVADKPTAEKKPKPDKVAEPVVEPIAHKVVETKPEPVVTPAEEPEEVLPEPVAEVLPEPTPEPEVVAEPEPEPGPVLEVREETVVEEPAPAPVVAAKPVKAKPVAKAPRRAAIDEDMWEELEETLLAADFGPDITEELIDVMRANVAKFGTTDPEDFIRLLREAIEDRLNKFDTTLKLSERPAVILVVGVNGVGKTTTIGKVAKYISNAGKSVVVGAADTFRAAAVDQLATWAERAGVDVVKPQMEGQDPSAVAYQTIEWAINKGTEIVIIDTAGRLQTKSGLMDELSKIRRVIEKQAPISEVLLVLDATTGQNGLSQAEAFLEHAGVTGLVLTKLDGSAKGGFVLAVQERTGIPVKLVGNGEGINDLIGFTPHAFAAQLVG
ncbi:Signal recognition particle receptor FtsY [Aurantimicrobium photophilum]|uniref:Signal recognition particle receptor FtsY n=1 Tax=Aurantimicrobium photophilum TaxID=1987356 RepID=A0A2Z3S2I0_9MICO|nr:Signal recognition particle receptor FtsY [Aurantimicrobium photophilum]